MPKKEILTETSPDGKVTKVSSDSDSGGIVGPIAINFVEGLLIGGIGGWLVAATRKSGTGAAPPAYAPPAYAPPAYAPPAYAPPAYAPPAYAPPAYAPPAYASPAYAPPAYAPPAYAPPAYSYQAPYQYGSQMSSLNFLPRN